MRECYKPLAWDPDGEALVYREEVAVTAGSVADAASRLPLDGLVGR